MSRLEKMVSVSGAQTGNVLNLVVFNNVTFDYPLFIIIASYNIYKQFNFFSRQ